MFCGYACIVFAMRGDLVTRRAVHRLRGRARHARRPHRAHDQHDERVRPRARFARRHHLVRRGAGRAGVRVGTVRARPRRLGGRLPLPDRRRDAAGALQHPVVGASSTSAISSACRRRPRPASSRRPCSRGRIRWSDLPQAIAAVAVVLVPAALMVSTIRFRSFKTINFGWSRRTSTSSCSPRSSRSSRPSRASRW